jgi:hypothetical protein
LEGVIVRHGQPDIHQMSAGRHVLHGQGVGKGKRSLRGGERGACAEKQNRYDFAHALF